ncbi:MAG: alpha/beta hydrolase [Candidatus Bathyarchaeota archaeon]|nr:MAG: alpha/beta hydrolase [Candidatus Bathyarchaeota archaeon]
MVPEIKRRTIQTLIAGFLAVLMLSSLPIAEALDQETIMRRDLVIDLGDGLMTDAKFTYPSVGEGPFPGVLLIPGGGTPDMDEYMPPYATETGKPARPFLQIAEYLSERGFAVLRYNKRGIGFNSTLVDPEVFFDTTIQDLERDAEKALEVLMQQSEVEAGDITLIGHSESTIIAPRIAVDNPSVKKIVLMGTAGRSYYDIKYFKTVDLRVIFAEDVLDTDHDGLLSIPEVIEGLGPGAKAAISAQDLIENSTGEWLWRPHWNPDGDDFVNIEEEFESFLVRLIEYAMTAEYPGSKLAQSQLALESTMDMIGNVSSSILILQGENDILTPFEDASLLEQRLTESGHPDHTLITYTGLGHYFYPEDYWSITMGPIQDYVLHDLEAWLKDPARRVRGLVSQLQTAENTIENLQGQLGDVKLEFEGRTSQLESSIEELQSESTSLRNTIIELDGRNMELQSALDSSKNLTYIALGVAIIAVITEVALIVQIRSRS